MKAFLNFSGIEKLCYIVAIPSVLAYGGFAIYKKNFLDLERRGEQIKAVEDKYLPRHRGNLVKLQNYKQKVFAIGLVDDILNDTSDLQKDEARLKQFQLNIAQNAALVRDFIKELQPEEIVLELCDERFENEIRDILSHPNYDKTMNKVQLLLDAKDPEKITRLKDIAIDHGNFELLVGFDTCQFRSTCRAVNGDRCFSLTQKRFAAKSQML